MAKGKTVAPEVPPAAPEVELVEQPVVEQPQSTEPVEQALEVTAPPEVEVEVPPAAPELVKARVLAHCAHGKPDDVIEIDAALAKSLADVLDPDPAAVAYAESLK